MSSQPEAVNLEAPVKTAKQLEKEAKKLEKLKKFQEKQVKVQQTKEVTKEKSEKKEVKKKETKDEPIVYTSITAPGEKKDVLGPLPNSYSPKYVEAAWYPWWQKQGFFKPEYGRKSISEKNVKGKFVMVIPPPNVTGTLHLGHALTNAVEDSITRWHRMKGKTTLWNPGCDHAGIATQVVVEKKLWREEKKTRHDVGRDKFVEKVWEWKQEKGDRIYEQMKLMGSSLDWDRACFTMDPKLSRAVTEAFVILHEAGDIYRSERLVHWSCSLKSAISDIEVDKVELPGRTLLTVPGYSSPVEFGVLASFAYQLEDGSGEIVVATTRLETLFADVAVAVHPEDDRYKSLVGKKLVHPFCDRRIPIIADSFVEKDFGTGAVKISPGHDHNDYEVAQRLSLPLVTVFNGEGVIVGEYGEFSGMKRFDARIRVTEVLNEKGLYRGTVSHAMVVPLCSRSKDVVEPLLKPQWYVRTGEMAEKAVQAVKSGELSIIPDHHTKTWYQWLENNRDWCISRQLWWGHRIPAYHVTFKDPAKAPKEVATNDVWVSGRTQEEAETKAASLYKLSRTELLLRQDEDVLDTWFSSGLFPFSVFGWPDKTPELEAFYPGELLETGHDILFFWVARMVFFGQRLLGKLPFKQVFLHPIVRDAHGRKMSKSLGNVIDPLHVVRGISLQDLTARLEADSNLDPKERARAAEGQKRDYPAGIPECGTDALRFALAAYMTQGRDINLDILRVQGYRFFCNKIWNASRFSLSLFSSLFSSLDNILSSHSYLVDKKPESHEPLLDASPEGGRVSGVDWLFHAMFCERVVAPYVHLSRWFAHLSALKTSEDSVVEASLTEASQLKASGIDSWILSRLADAVSICNTSFEKYEFNTVTSACYNLWLYELCDVYLECIKPVMSEGSLIAKAHAASTLLTVLDAGLRLISPFMPFLSEELYQRLPTQQPAVSITVAPYPEQDSFEPLRNVSLEQDFEFVQRIYQTIRSLRSDYQVVKSQKTEVFVTCSEPHLSQVVSQFSLTIRTLAYCSAVQLNQAPPPGCAISTLSEKCSVHLLLQGLIKVDKEIERLHKKEEYLKQVITKLKDQAASEDYETKVPASVRQQNSEKLTEAEGELSRLPQALAALQLIQ